MYKVCVKIPFFNVCQSHRPLEKSKQTSCQRQAKEDVQPAEKSSHKVRSSHDTVKSKVSVSSGVGGGRKSQESYTAKREKSKKEGVVENVVTVNDKLPKKIYIANESMFERPRSVSSKPSSGKIRHHRVILDGTTRGVDLGAFLRLHFLDQATMFGTKL
jgi:hypothetical protein